MKKLLLHSCCGPCSTHVIEQLIGKYDLTIFYFNPNIFPENEYVLRREQFEKLGVKVVDIGYEHDKFLDLVKGMENESEGGRRCNVCIAMRMDKAFEYAKNHNFDILKKD